MKNVFKPTLRILLLFLFHSSLYIEHANAAQDPLFQLIGNNYTTVKLSKFVNVFSGAKKQRFHPMGKVQVKLNREVLKEVLPSLH